MVGKIVASSLTLSIGGSGGVFAPSLFTGAAGGMAFGATAHHIFGSVVGPPAIYAVVAMGGVVAAAAAQAPLTAIASVVEMTGNFTLVLPVMLAAGIAAAVSKRFSYGSIYTTKLLRRGIDIERPKATGVLQALTVADVMQPLPQGKRTELAPHADAPTQAEARDRVQWEALVGPVTVTRRPQTLMSDETLEQALRQLDLYGLVGLPVLTPDRHHLTGWMTRRDVIRAIAQNLSASASEAVKGTLAAEFAIDDPESHLHDAPNPLEGYSWPPRPMTGHRRSPILPPTANEFMLNPPGPVLRSVLRLPVYLYRWKLGWMLGHRFLLIVHEGQRTAPSHDVLNSLSIRPHLFLPSNPTARISTQEYARITGRQSSGTCWVPSAGLQRLENDHNGI